MGKRKQSCPDFFSAVPLNQELSECLTVKREILVDIKLSNKVWLIEVDGHKAGPFKEFEQAKEYINIYLNKTFVEVEGQTTNQNVRFVEYEAPKPEPKPKSNNKKQQIEDLLDLF